MTRTCLGPDDALPLVPRRVLVSGASGSGKTTLARRLGAVLDLPHVEVDGLYHGPGWTARPTFVEDVTRAAAADRWVMEWQYEAVRPLLAERAELLVWLDLPRRVVMRQVVRRTLRRRLRRLELWNGNVEPPLRTFFTDREHIVRWAWSSYPEATTRIAQLPPSLPVVRLRSRREVERWMRGPLVRQG